MARRHQAGELLVGSATEEVHAPDVELAGEPTDPRFGVAGADDVDADALVVLLEEVRGAHDMLQPVQRYEARVHEHPKHRIVRIRPGLDHVVVGTDPDAPQSTPTERRPSRRSISRACRCRGSSGSQNGTRRDPRASTASPRHRPVAHDRGLRRSRTTTRTRRRAPASAAGRSRGAPPARRHDPENPPASHRRRKDAACAATAARAW